MDFAEREAEPEFSKPIRQITIMLIVLGLLAAGAWVALPRILPLFVANIWLNGFICLVFVFGVLACFWQVLQLFSSVNWIVGFASNRIGHELVTAPRLLAPLAALLRSRGARMQISSSSASSILDSVATRIDEARDITRYIVNLLIFLGLLGTFYGLATTVPAVVETIRSLAPQEGETGVAVFEKLMAGLEAQLGGMGTAFSSSLLGLAGSLVVGLLELFAGHGQNRFYRELEEWLSTITRLGFSSGESEGHSESGQMVAVLDHMAEQMEAMQTMFTQSDVSRSMVDERLGNLVLAVENLTQTISQGPETTALQRVAEGQERLIETLQSRAGAADTGNVDAESRMRLRSIDVQLLRILEEISAGRQESITDLRTDIAGLTNIIRQATQTDPQG
ncbi:MULTISPECIES: biopolymer transporter ExbB [Halocynthiibacter]|uniref:Biopolymer transporter ExbB n=1 Tax=Halocynthiibacter halioticoli TaxID=2986804 RepID=A0AAE3LQM6_9RHOB|nr:MULTISPECIES: biopolymer transporter ExbB [Halocynthiibacter]MCV6823679.1 biopolymer transporter ExbB [Halocynthiibacter halioticoli]MCW4056680.1 biopolymer transporter ExbB [Halocynthiibacter sp. SDUM655004]